MDGWWMTAKRHACIHVHTHATHTWFPHTLAHAGRQAGRQADLSTTVLHYSTARPLYLATADDSCPGWARRRRTAGWGGRHCNRGEDVMTYNEGKTIDYRRERDRVGSSVCLAMYVRPVARPPQAPPPRQHLSWSACDVAGEKQTGRSTQCNQVTRLLLLPLVVVKAASCVRSSSARGATPSSAKPLWNEQNIFLLRHESLGERWRAGISTKMLSVFSIRKRPKVHATFQGRSKGSSVQAEELPGCGDGACRRA